MHGATADMNGNFHPDWWAKTSAGAILGFGLALSLVGLFAYLGPGGIDPTGAAHLGRFALMRFLLPPIWAAVMGFVFLFPSGRSAWFWLGGTNLIAFGALAACRFYFFA